MNSMPKRSLLLKLSILSFLTILISCSQKGSLEQNLKSLDNKNYKVLDSYLKNRTVVGIGEYTHGDGELFELKTEIIKHLHEDLGFEAVLMESDFLAVENTLSALSTHSKKSAANMGIQSTWANSKEYLSLIDYLEATAKKGDTLHFHGFDPQMTGTASMSIHIAQVQLIKNKISSEAYDNLISAITILKDKNISAVTLDSLKYLKTSVTHIKKIKNKISPKTYQWLKNIEGNLNAIIYLKLAPPMTPENIPKIFSHPNYLKSGSIRDSLMADNINFYLKKYNKVIVWAANNHLKLKSDDRTWMGELLKNSLGDKYYSILVLYNHGVWSYPQGEPNGIIPEPVEGTLAFEIAHLTNANISFLDINSTQIPKMKIRTNNWITTDSIMINNYCDAILYVRKATGSTMAKDNN
jgi:erythromycin esterase-like protein